MELYVWPPLISFWPQKKTSHPPSWAFGPGTREGPTPVPSPRHLVVQPNREWPSSVISFHVQHYHNPVYLRLYSFFDYVTTIYNGKLLVRTIISITNVQWKPSLCDKKSACIRRVTYLPNLSQLLLPTSPRFFFVSVSPFREISVTAAASSTRILPNEEMFRLERLLIVRTISPSAKVWLRSFSL